MRVLFPLFFSFCAFSFCLTAQAREQYQSKQLLDPSNNLNESAIMSIQELENSLNSIDNAYAKASTERHLARHYLKNKEYDKAIAFYEEALSSEGLSSYANVEMLGELIAVYMLKKDYRNADKTINKFVSQGGKPDTKIYLMQAQAKYKLKDFVGTSAALDKALQSGNGKNAHSAETLNRALALYYSIGNYNKSADILKQLLNRNPNESANWQRLASMYIKQGKHQTALNVLTLAWEKNIPFNAKEVVLLADLYASQNNPHQGARILQEGIDRGIISPDSKTYQRLFNYWLQAKEKKRAVQALEKAASLTRDTELNLYLAQLHMEADKWQAMQDTMLRACKSHIEDRFVGKANLLLGISQMKLGDSDAARRSFINATLVGGANDEAGQYLRFMKAEPPSPREKRYLSGPCQSKSTASVFASQSYKAPKKQKSSKAKPTSQAKTSSTGNKSYAPVQSKTVSSQKLFYTTYTFTPEQMKDELSSKAIKLALTATKSGGTIDGPMHLIFEEPLQEGAEEVTFKLAFPIKGSVRSRGKNKVTSDRGFKCTYVSYEGSEEGLATAWKKLYDDTLAAGHTLSDESRQIFSEDNSPGSKTIKAELQLGIK